MGTPAFYWYPDAAGSLETTSLGELLSDLQETPLSTVEDAYGGNGFPYRSFLGGSFRIRILLERFGTPATSTLERELRSMEAHLHRGGMVGFTADTAKTWCGFQSGTWSRGDASVATGGNAFRAWSSGGTLAANDEVVMESENPEANREFQLVSAISATGTVTFSGDTLLYSYGASAESSLARWRDFYPVLWLPRDQVGKPIVHHDHRRNWTLDVTLEYCIGAVLALYEADNVGMDARWFSPATGGLDLATASRPLGGSAGRSMQEAIASSTRSKFTSATSSNGQTSYQVKK